MTISSLGGVTGEIVNRFRKPMTDFLFVFHCDFLSISHRLKIITHSNFRWDFPVWGKILAVLGAGDPQNVNFNNFLPQKARVSMKPRRLMHNT